MVILYQDIVHGAGIVAVKDDAITPEIVDRVVSYSYIRPRLAADAGRVARVVLVCIVDGAAIYRYIRRYMIDTGEQDGAVTAVFVELTVRDLHVIAAV